MKFSVKEYGHDVCCEGRGHGIFFNKANENLPFHKWLEELYKEAEQQWRTDRNSILHWQGVKPLIDKRRGRTL